MPKKPILATEAELQEAEARVTDLIKKVQAEASQGIAATEGKWKAACEMLQQKQDANCNTAASANETARSEAKSYTEECITGLNDALLAMFPPIEARITEEKELSAKNLDDVDTKIQQLIVDELSALAAQFDEELTSMKGELTQNLHDWGREAAEALVEQRRQVDVSIEELRVACLNARTAIQDATKQQFDDTLLDQNNRDKVQDEKHQAELDEVYAEFGRVHDSINQRKNEAHDHTTQVQNKGDEDRAALAEQNHQRLVRLTGEASQLREGLREVENVSTRRIEWVVKQASSLIKPPEEGWCLEKNTRSWYSPKFNGAGAWGMQFELQLFGPPPPKGSPQEAVVHGTGNMGVAMWACKGTRMAFKLYIGERALPMEKKFKGTSPAGTGRLCWLKDQINKSDDTLRIGVEFLESMREVEYPIRIPPPPLALTGRAPDDIDGVMKAIDVLEGEQAEIDDRCGSKIARPFEEEDGFTHLPGSICYMRHLNNRIMDQVETKVSGMESRMVRKVQWLVQHASKLRQYFPWGQAICSPCFNASGIDKMQFALYPSGYGSVTDGFCSLFLYCPAGATLRVFISMAKQVRELSHYWDSAGAFGRTNFCLFNEQIMDLVDDTIMVTLEIEEAQQDVCTPWTHQGESKEATDLASITKLTKNPGKTPNGRPNGREGKMDDAMNLASIWTAKAFVEEGCSDKNVPEGYHSFDAIMNRKPMPLRPDSRGGHGSPPPAVRVGRSESAAALLQDKNRSAMQEDLSPPLPPVSAGSITLGSATSGWDTQPPGGASSFGKAQKAAPKDRRNRPGSSGATRDRFSATS